MKRTFNDDYYGVDVAEWERERIPAVTRYARMEWGVSVAVAVLLAVSAGSRSFWDYSLREWLAIGAFAFLGLQLFVFLHEINENIRFVRHKLEMQRQAWERTADASSVVTRIAMVCQHSPSLIRWTGSGPSSWSSFPNIPNGKRRVMPET